MVEIKIYITQDNQWCKQLRLWLKKKKYPFEILDLEESDSARDWLLQKSNQMAIPLVEVDDEIIIGYQPEKIEAAVQKHKTIQ